MILHPMVEDGKEAIGSMGDDAPLAVLSDTYRGMHHYFRQNFSQVTNPPIDSLRERNVMTLRTRLGNLGNILDENPEQSEMLSLQSPIVLNAEFEAMRKYMGETACRIDCTFDARGGLDAMRQAFERICKEAEDGVRSGCLHVVLTDANVNSERAALPMILAAGCVHSFLVRQSLRTFTSLNVRSGECLDVHYAAVIIGVGATTVNPYLAEETIAARHAPRPVRQAHARPVPRQLQEGARRRAAEGDVQDGHLGSVVLSRRLQFRGGGPLALAGRRVLPRHALAHLGHRPARRAGEDRRAARPRLRRGRGLAADRRLLQDAARRRPAQFRGQPHPHAAGRGEHRDPTRSTGATPSRCAACRRSTCATCWTSRPTVRPSPSTRSN